MSNPIFDIDDRLAELGRATDSVGARPGFEERVMQAIQMEPMGWMSELLSLARRLLPLGLLAAASTLGWAMQTESAATEDLAVSYGALSYEALSYDAISYNAVSGESSAGTGAAEGAAEETW